MVHVTPKQCGKNVRMNFGKINEVLEMPNLIEVQKNSYKWFREKGLREVFRGSTRFWKCQTSLRCRKIRISGSWKKV